MKTLRSLLCSLILVACVVSIPAQRLIATAGDVSSRKNDKIAFVLDGEIYITGSHHPTAIKLNHANGRGEFPVWSPNGKFVAFVQDAISFPAGGTLVVLNSDATPVSRVKLDASDHPLMGRIEGLKWSSQETIVLTGSINPSSVESIVINIKKRRIVESFADDLGQPQFSPNGKHAEFVTGMPHFASVDDYKPEVHIDNENITVFPFKGMNVVLKVSPLWAGDSSQLAIPFEDKESHAQKIFVWKSQGHSYTIALKDSKAKWPGIQWDKHDVIVTSDTSVQRYRNGVLQPPRRDSPSQDSSYRRERQVWLDKITAQGGYQLDFWCGNCQPNTIPRGQGMGTLFFE